MALDENVAATLSGGVSSTFGYSADGSGTGPYEQLVTFLQGPVFGLLYGSYMSQEEQKEWDRFVEKIEGIAGEAEARRQATFEGAPVERPSTRIRIREGVNFNAETREVIQSRIDAGTAPESWIGQFTERVIVPAGGRRPRTLQDRPTKARATGGGFLGAVGRVAREGLAASEEFYGAAPQRFTDFADPIREGYAGLEREGRAGAAGLVSDQEARERRLMGMAEGLGEQERRDIQQAYRAEWGNQQARLVQAGLAGTGVASSAAYVHARERTDALGRFEERTRREQLGLSERLSGETLQARAGELEFGLGLGRERLGVEAELGAAGLMYGEAAWASQQADRERFGLMPAEAGLMAEEDWRRLHVGSGGIQYAPPYGTGQGAQITGLAA